MCMFGSYTYNRCHSNQKSKPEKERVQKMLCEKTQIDDYDV